MVFVLQNGIAFLFERIERKIITEPHTHSTHSGKHANFVNKYDVNGASIHKTKCNYLLCTNVRMRESAAWCKWKFIPYTRIQNTQYYTINTRKLWGLSLWVCYFKTNKTYQNKERERWKKVRNANQYIRKIEETLGLSFELSFRLTFCMYYLNALELTLLRNSIHVICVRVGD